jgi:hypothetical protein
MPDERLTMYGISKCEMIIFGKEDIGNVKNQAQNYRLLVVKASIPSPTAPEKQMHAICFSVATDSRTIRYQDPLGHSMPPHIAEGIQDYFPDYSVIDHKIPQQKVGTKDCGPITIRNMLALAVEENIPTSINIQSIRSEDWKYLESYRSAKEEEKKNKVVNVVPSELIQWNDFSNNQGGR